jgi:hypothetical protein
MRVSMWNDGIFEPQKEQGHKHKRDKSRSKKAIDFGENQNFHGRCLRNVVVESVTQRAAVLSSSTIDQILVHILQTSKKAQLIVYRKSKA